MAKVCILTAGKGTRMNAYAAYANKAILPINFKALLTHIFERFPAGTEFVIAVGYYKEQVISYLKMAHPDVPIQLNHVDNYDGPGSGPGHSLFCCKEFLHEPFYFVACDTQWDEELKIDESQNWVGVAPVQQGKSDAYCNFEIDAGRVLAIKDKQKVSSENHAAFTGLCYIKDYDLFWKGIEAGTEVAGELQISSGLQALLENSQLKIRQINWIDVGDYEKYKEAVSRYENYDFSKTNEFLYLTQQKVIKFFADPNIAAKRVTKARLIPDIFPKIEQYENQFYCYDFVPGRTLYTFNSPGLFRSFLEFMDTRVWKLRPQFDKARFSRLCQSFYYKKTMERIEKYYEKYAQSSEKMVIRGTEVPPLVELLDKVPWDEIYNGIPSFIHGDLQFDNIISKPDGGFLLLDWRQDFAGEVEVGDLYYDLAKLAGGILLNYDYIKQNLLSYSEGEGGVEFDFATRFGAIDYISILERFIISKGWNLAKVRLLVPLIYLNMSPLHHYPFDKMLFSLGKLLLHRQLNCDASQQ